MRLDWQRQAVILFAASLLVLCVVLVFFALREAERENLLNERELEGAGQLLAETVDSQAQSLIDEAERRVREAFGEIPPELSLAGGAAVERLGSEVPLVSELFVVNELDQIIVLGGRPLYLLPGQEPPECVEIAGTLASNELWDRAEAAEFRRNDPAQAAALYLRVADRSSDPARKAFALNRTARSYAKMGQSDKALAAYERQLKAHLPDLVSEGIPLDITALYQTGNIQFELERQAEAAGAFLDLYRGLVAAEWALTRDQFEFFRRVAEERLVRVTEGMDTSRRQDWAGRLRDLKDREREPLARTRALEKVRERVVPRVRLEAGSRGADPGKSIRIAEPTGDGILLVSFLVLDDGTMLGLLIDPERLATEALSPAKDGSGEPGARFGLTASIVDASGRNASDRGPARPEGLGESQDVQRVSAAAFSGGFPPWSIEVRRTGAGAAERQFRTRRAVYLLALGAVVAALIFGGFLAIRSTAKELRLARLKSDFTATVSHEFRTPLTSIRYMAELLQRGRVPDEARKQEYYETISGESERLSRLVENLLDFSKIEAGVKEYRMEAADVAALAADVAGRFRRQAALKDFVLETEIADGLPRVRVDRDALGRAVFNLLDNAVKYSGQDPRIILRVWAAGDDVRLQVEDHGVGISKPEQKRIFEKFYRAGSATESEVKGSGIGLPLVEHVARAHGGDVELESEPGRGTRVTIRIPVGLPEEKREGGNG
jgi:signal transduction histidine kinase/tetratricopeptide (TPR) repeat protein